MKRSISLIIFILLLISFSNAFYKEIKTIKILPQNNTTFFKGSSIDGYSKLKNYNNEPLEELKKDNKLVKFVYKFVTPNIKDNQPLCLSIGPIENSLKIYLNNSLISNKGSNGENGSNINGTVFHTTKTFLPKEILNKENKENFLIIESYIQKSNMVLPDLAIGSYDEISKNVFNRNLFNVYIIEGIAIFSLILFIMGIFYYIYYKYTEIKYLYFSAFCFFFFLSYAKFLFNHDTYNDLFFLKLSRAGITILIAYLALFFINFLKVWDKKVILKYIIYFFCYLSLPLIFMQDNVFDVEKVFNIFSGFVIKPLLILQIVLLIVALRRENQITYWVLLLAVIILMVTGVYDIGYLKLGKLPYNWTVAYGYTFMFVSIYLILVKEQSDIYFESIESKKEILTKNDELKNTYNKIKESINTLNNSIGTFSLTAKSLSENTKHVNDHADNILSNNEKINETILKISDSANVSHKSIISVSSNVNEISSAINDISNKTKISKNKTNLAVDMVQKSDVKLQELSDSIKEISHVTDIINDIADQTKLLSLNATIEAASAGEAGKGFGVVAGEVKNLAAQTVESVISINSIAEKTQNSSSSTVKDMNNIRKVIEEANEITNNITTVLEEQSQVVMNVSENLNSAVLGSEEIASNISETVDSTAHITDKMKEITDETDSLTDISNTIQSQVKELQKILTALDNVVN